MEDHKDKGKTKQEEQIQKFRLSITHKNVKEIEAVCNTILDAIKTVNKEQISIIKRGPIRLPTKILNITTRKAPCGNGTCTFDRFEMRIHKRIIDVECTSSHIKLITKVSLPAGIIVDATKMDNIE